MNKLTTEQRELINELLNCSHDQHITQCLLNSIGEQNWTRGTLSSAHNECLTPSQRDLFYAMGGHYDVDEVTEHLYEWLVECAIAKRLLERGVSAYLAENKDYLAALREGREVLEWLDVEAVRQEVIAEGLW